MTPLLLVALLHLGAPPRVVSYNVQALTNGVEGVVATLRPLDADVVALQEVDVLTRRSGGVDQVAQLARLLGMHAAFGKTMDFDGGAYGVALLSRQPLENVRVVPLPRHGDEEPRVALMAQTRLGGSLVTVITTHLCANWHAVKPASIREHQAHVLARLVAEQPGPLLLLGDFNAQPGEAPLRILEGTLPRISGGLPTWPVPKPVTALDHIFARPPLRLLKVSTLTSTASDHLPLVVDLGPGTPD